MIINKANLDRVFTGLKTVFQEAVVGYKAQWTKVATVVTSTTRTEDYSWIGDTGSIREWIGDRVVQSLKAFKYSITNKSFERTIGVDRDDIDDGALGGYSIQSQSLGEDVAQFPDTKLFGLLKVGNTTPCYDGQNFFDTDHPVLDEAGQVTLVSNITAGAGPAWYLLDASRAIKPLIWQVRKVFDFVAMINFDDENVFMRKEYLYGVDARCNVGFGLWQMAHRSTATLDAANFNAAYAAMRSVNKDGGNLLGINPTLLVVPPSLRAAALDIVKTEKLAGGATNVNLNIVDVLETPWVA